MIPFLLWLGFVLLCAWALRGRRDIVVEFRDENRLIGTMRMRPGDRALLHDEATITDHRAPGCVVHYLHADPARIVVSLRMEDAPGV